MTSKSKIVQYSDSETDDDSIYDCNDKQLGKFQSRKRKTEPHQASSCSDEDRDSASEEENFKKGNKEKRKKLLPIPSDVLSMFKDVASSEDSADDHKGRIRSFPHEQGNWASYVFIPAKLSYNQKALIKALVDRARKTLSQFELIDNKAIHITLSKTVSLRHYWIEPLVDQLKDLLSDAQSFRCHLDLIELYTNEEKTRSFLGLRIILGEEKLKALTEKIDQVMEKFGLPKYYENPSFHISFAWHLGDVTNTVPPGFTEALQNLVDSFDAELSEDESYLNFRALNVENICLKTGNKVYYIKS